MPKTTASMTGAHPPSPRVRYFTIATLLALATFAGLIASSRAANAVVAYSSRPTLLLAAAAQDGEIFLTWSPIPRATYTISWRGIEHGQWTHEVAEKNVRALNGLQNGIPHEFRVEASTGESSAVVTATPRPRPGCETLAYVPPPPNVDFFCTKAALDTHLAERAIDPLSLRCRQQPVTDWTADAPNCHYVTLDGDHKLLLRSADSRFIGGSGFADPEVVRRHARRALWPRDDPFDGTSDRTPALVPATDTATGDVTRHRAARAFQVATTGGPVGTITWFEPHDPATRRFAIYHEGHGGAAVDIGAETIDWLLARGWQVIALDMPLLGGNAGAVNPVLRGHADFEALDDGSVSPLEHFLLPVKAAVDAITAAASGDPDILLIGRSGGGWTSYVYGALDPRIDIAVSVAGGRPISTRLDAPWGAAELGDYEQTAPHLYDAAPHENLMLAAGSRAAFYVFNRWDTCCFRVRPGDSFVRHLRRGSRALGKPVGVYVDPEHRGHSMSDRAYAELGRFLRRVLP